MISTVVFDDKLKFLTDLKNKLRYQKKVKITASTRDFSELEAMLAKNRIDVLIFGPSLGEDDMVSLAETVSASFPRVGIVLIASKVTTELLRKALRTGAKDVLANTQTGKELAKSLEVAYQQSQRFRTPVTDVRPQSPASEPRTKKAAKVVTFFSAKGGVGKTFVATNTGVGLVQQTKKKVILLDLNLQFGDVAVMLRLQPELTISEVVSAIDRLDAEMMKGFLTPHSSGLKTLLAPVEPDKADAISGEEVVKIIEILKGMCDYLLIDTPPSFNDNTLAALDNSDEIVLVASLDIPSLKNTKLSLNMMDLLQYPNEKVKILLNRANSRVSLNLRDVEHSLGTKTAAIIPSNIVVPLSVNKGIPLIIDAPRTPVARNLSGFVKQIMDGDGARIPKSAKGKIALNSRRRK